VVYINQTFNTPGDLLPKAEPVCTKGDVPSYELKSAGADGVYGTPDDLISREPD
jgi:hypothetical protein